MNDELINKYMGFVYAAAKRFKDRGSAFDDIVQAGALGLIKAVNNRTGGGDRDEKGFAAYAFAYIEGEIRSFIRNDRLIHIPKEKLKADEAEICGRYTIDRVISLEALCGERGDQRFDAKPEQSLGTASETDPEQSAVDRVFLLTAMNRLTEQEREIVRARYFHDLTQAQTAQLLGLTQSCVSKTEHRAIQKMRNWALKTASEERKRRSAEKTNTE